jgi:hypothetical protein
MGECQLCDDIWQMFTDPENAKRKIVFGSFDEALASPCLKHTPILQAFREYVGDSSSTDVGFQNPGNRRWTYTLFESVSKLGPCWPILLANKVDAADHPGTGQILDPDWVNMDTLRYWIAQCPGLHASCTTAMNTAPTIPALLVDVRRKCIVLGVSNCRYVALSYRFGRAAYFRLSGALLQRLQQESSLNSPEILGLLPLTVRHAIALVEALGETYLWTDSLCITHEDPGALDGQLEQMAAIYSSAFFTIVANDGDGTSGILGLPGISEPRDFIQRRNRFGGEDLVICRISEISMSMGSDYHSRGWTYQEFLMSARKLIFYKGKAHWMCQCCQWREDLALGVEIETYIVPHLQLLVAGFPDLECLGHLLGDYNKRNLTFDEDALPAIAGLLAFLSRTFANGFLYDLPEMMFDTALGWDRSRRCGETTKRVSSRLGPIDRGLPTWSWLSWRGNFEWGDLTVGEMRVKDVRVGDVGVKGTNKYNSTQETSPITEWYASSRLEGEPRRKIVPTWYKERERAKDPRQPLADGWTRCEATAGVPDRNVRLFPDGCGSHVYEHHNTSVGDIPIENRVQRWYYPFRVLLTEPSTPFFNPPRTRYLFCKTWKATVLASQGSGMRLNLRKDAPQPVTGTLNSNRYEQLGQFPYYGDYSSDDVIGTLNPHSFEQCGQFPYYGNYGSDEPTTRRTRRFRRIKVVAINRAVVFSHQRNTSSENECPPIKRDEYVTVLWVEWQGAFYTRQACGRIEREAWEELDLEEIDLILG